MFDGIYSLDAKKGLTKKLTAEEVAALPNEDRRDLNLIYKKWGDGRFMSMRLLSFPSRKEKDRGKRVISILLEFGVTDKNDKLTSQNQVYMDVPTFTWFCELMKTGALRKRIEDHCDAVRSAAIKAAENDAKKRGLERPDYAAFAPDQKAYSAPAYEAYGGNEKECRMLKVYTGWDFKAGKRSDKICFEASKGPGKVTGKGGISPDYSKWTKENSSRVMVGFTDDDLGEAGMAGLRAVEIMNMWSAFGLLEEKTALLNPRRESQPGNDAHGYEVVSAESEAVDYYDGLGFGDDDF